jgi:hypothetical protein
MEWVIFLITTFCFFIKCDLDSLYDPFSFAHPKEKKQKKREPRKLIVTDIGLLANDA